MISTVLRQETLHSTQNSPAMLGHSDMAFRRTSELASGETQEQAVTEEWHIQGAGSALSMTSHYLKEPLHTLERTEEVSPRRVEPEITVYHLSMSNVFSMFLPDSYTSLSLRVVPGSSGIS